MSKNYPIIQRLGTATPTGADITLNTGGFANVLGAGDVDVQAAMDTIDDMSFINITDTPASFTDQRVLFETASAVTDSANFTYDSANDILNVGAVQLKLIDTFAHSEGLLHWNDDDKTLNLDTEVTGTSIQVGQESVIRCTNKTGVTITNGSVVYINGAQGQRPTIALADADLEATADAVIGIVTADIANNATGYVTNFGMVRDLDTSAYTVGDTIWLSQTAGEFTNVRPAAPAHAIRLGYVTTVNATTGVILLSVDTGSDLKNDHDVNLTGLANDDVLQYNSATTLWENTASPLLALADGSTGVTQSPGDNSTKLATTAYTDAAVTNNLEKVSVPSTSSDVGTTNQIAWDTDYIYVCTAANTWKRVGLSTW